MMAARDGLGSGSVGFGDHHLSVLVRERDLARLDDAAAQAAAALADSGAIVVREDTNLEPSFWGQFPGNEQYLVRRAMISTANMQRIEAAEIDDKLVQRLAEQVARVSHQGINREHPLLGATLPDGARIQFCGPPATRKHWAMAIRRHRRLDLPLDAYDAGPLTERGEPVLPDAAAEPIAFLRAAIAAKKTILISGGTSTGKTTFLNAMLGEIPSEERVILVEDTPELRLPGANGVGLVAVKGELGEAKVTANELLQSALRLRPDRIVLGELRGAESVSFLRAINTGHPGSFSTIHVLAPVPPVLAVVPQLAQVLADRRVAADLALP